MVEACGRNDYGQCDIPPLDKGVAYTHMAAGAFHSLLLRSDGTIATCGSDADGMSTIPSLQTWVEWLNLWPAKTRYVADLLQNGGQGILLLQASCDGRVVRFDRLSGETAYEMVASPSEDRQFSDLQVFLTRELRLQSTDFDVIFPEGELLSKLVAGQPFMSISSVLSSSEQADRMDED